MQNTSSLRAESSATVIRIFRGQELTPILEQHAPMNERPYIHPIVAPDGKGILTENAPPHHPWQHGVYTGLNDVNGIGFWAEGIHNDPKDGSFRPFPLTQATAEANRVMWKVEADWLDPSGAVMLKETQNWVLKDHGNTYFLDMEWSLHAATDLTFGQYPYGGLFLRMPFRDETGGQAINSEGQLNGKAEGQRARWVSVSMPIEGRDDQAGIAYMDHPTNTDHPVPWRVDYQMGISPSRCIAGEWKLAKDKIETARYRVFVFCGATDVEVISRSWDAFAAQ
ncbi:MULTISPECIES: PmoA family protein [unclassified Paenibacillus]|uniref:DUF6807 domain-containing protein n=1 Tax=unclassified Paenibacillus TaxID=185978 RepID=UPI002F3EEF31